MLYFSSQRSRAMLTADGISIIMATTAPLLKLRHASQHFIVENRGHHIVPASHRRRNSIIRKAQEKCTVPWKLPAFPAEALPRFCRKGFLNGLSPITLDTTENFLVNVAHGIENQQERHRKSVNHISEQQSSKAVNFKYLAPKQSGEKPLFSEGIDNGKAVCNRRKQHGQRRQSADQALKDWGVTLVY